MYIQHESLCLEKYRPGQKRDPKKWKANFRCAMNSLPDVEEVKERCRSKGHNAHKVYRFLEQRRSMNRRRQQQQRANQEELNYRRYIHNDNQQELKRKMRETVSTSTTSYGCEHVVWVRVRGRVRVCVWTPSTCTGKRSSAHEYKSYDLPRRI